MGNYDKDDGCHSTPANAAPRFCVPAEWEQHAACLLLCPHNPATFRIDRVHVQFRHIVRTIAAHEPAVVLGCATATQLRDYQAWADHEDNANYSIHCVLCPSNDSWARDTGPTFVVGNKHARISSSLRALDWQFNAYGGPADGCYWPCDHDKLVAKTLTDALKRLALVPSTTGVQSVPLILEGGSIHTDGQGTLLTTAECLLHPNRNPDKTREKIEGLVLEATGCSKMIWLDHGLSGDEDTNGHVDNWACFIRPGVMVLAWTDDVQHQPDNYARCRYSLKQLEAETDAQGRHLIVHKLHLPSPMYYSKEEVATLSRAVPPTSENPAVVQPREVGEVLAASYVNFYIANTAVLVPQYGDPIFDVKALETLRPLFPDRAVIGVQSREILLGGGNIHCITQQVPRVSPSDESDV